MSETDLIFFDESDEGSAFDFHGLPRPIVECDDKVEEVGFS